MKWLVCGMMLIALFGGLIGYQYHAYESMKDYTPLGRHVQYYDGYYSCATKTRLLWETENGTFIGNFTRMQGEQYIAETLAGANVLLCTQEGGF